MSNILRCSSVAKRVDHRRYNGAALVGLKGLVLKSHGSADALAFSNALERAYDAARNNLLDLIQQRVNKLAPALVQPSAQAQA